MFEVKKLIRQLLDSADLDKQARFSFRNYHALGVDYLCLLRDERFTAKAYFFNDSIASQWLVAPHNHRYTFEHWTIAGVIRHHLFNLVGGSGYWLHRYDAATRQSKPLTRVGLQEVRADELDAGKHYLLEPHEIHTISLPFGAAIAFQLQYADVADESVLFSRDVDVKCGTNSELYLPMSATQIQTRANELSKVLNEGRW